MECWSNIKGKTTTIRTILLIFNEMNTHGNDSVT